MSTPIPALIAASFFAAEEDKKSKKVKKKKEVKMITIDNVITDIEQAIENVVPYEKDRIFADNYRRWLKNLNDIKRLTTRKILLVEEGSIDGNDIEELSDMNYKVVKYRQGANMPTLLSSKDENDDF